MVSHPLGSMVRITPVGSAAAANDGPGISATSELSALLPALPAVSISVSEHEAPSLDGTPSIGVPFAQHNIATEEMTPAGEESAENREMTVKGSAV